MASQTGVVILSNHTVRPSTHREHQTIHLTPWDLRMISVDYVQKGMLFPKPQESEDSIISNLLSSFARALDIFYPLAGRLSTAVHHDTDPPTQSISLVCTGEGAEFIHATAADVTVSDIIAPLYIPTIVRSFWPLNGTIGHDGHSFPLIAVQATELTDGVFIACSLNHAVGDGTTFWRFINTWSEIARSRTSTLPLPVLDRSFYDACRLPIRLPLADDLVRRPVFTPVTECFFHFSAQSIAKLKAMANAEADDNSDISNTTRISSLQALLAHSWRCVTRARGLEPQQESAYVLLVGCRTRLSPPLPQDYLGNSVVHVLATAAAEDVVGRGLGWVAGLLNKAIATQSEEVVRKELDLWHKSPSIAYVGEFKTSCHVVTGSSPRFDMYGNDFGWGRPVAVRSGSGNKVDGKVTIYPGSEGEGSMALEVCLEPQAMAALLEDAEFMEVAH